MAAFSLPSGFFGIKALAGPGKGEYLCALYFNGQVFPLGADTRASRSGVRRFHLKAAYAGNRGYFCRGSIFIKKRLFYILL